MSAKECILRHKLTKIKCYRVLSLIIGHLYLDITFCHSILFYGRSSRVKSKDNNNKVYIY